MPRLWQPSELEAARRNAVGDDAEPCDCWLRQLVSRKLALFLVLALAWRGRRAPRPAVLCPRGRLAILPVCSLFRTYQLL
jgi:hypothetical protein